MNKPTLIERPDIDARLAENKKIVDSFDDTINGLTVLISGVSVEDAKAVGY